MSLFALFFRQLFGLPQPPLECVDEEPREEAIEVREVPEPEPEPEPDSDPEFSLPEPKPPSETPTVAPAIATLPHRSSAEGDEDGDDGLRKIKTVGVWAGRSSIQKPVRDIAFCVKNNINRIDIVINDHSRWRSPQGFDTYRESGVIELAEEALANDMEVHLMSWIMPHEDYIKKAAEVLIPLMEKTGATSLQWDAEEPWTRAHSGIGYITAAQLIAAEFRERKFEMGVNGIGYTSTQKFAPLSDICDYVVPQCYSTRTSKLIPETVVPKFVKRYRERFNPKKVVAGLAAYRQSGIPGHTADSAMRSALASAHATEGIDTVVYWSLASIRRDARVAKVIRSIRADL